jgi:hypothetical protein
MMNVSQALPNADHLFEEAFAASDPVPPLLRLMKEHPNFFAIEALVMFYFQAVEKYPANAPTLAFALANLEKSPDAPTFKQDKFFDLVGDALASLHFKFLDDEEEYGPHNSHLLESLLSGLSLKHGFGITPEMCAAIDRGLKVSRRSTNSETFVVGTCIQLLLHGVTITTKRVGCYRRRPGEVAEMLKAQRKAGIVKDPRAIQVLEVKHGLTMK